MRRVGLASCLLLLACGQHASRSAVSESPASKPPAAQTAAVPILLPDPGVSPLQALPAGSFAPLFPGRDGKAQIAVAAFRLEAQAVTNAQFAAFVAANGQWRRSRVSRLFADANYLADWISDTEPPAERLEWPACNVSWFAARAYARWRNRRLPTLAEWEYAAALPLQDGKDSARIVLDWYSKPASHGPGPVRAGTSNVYGVYDLHGLVWEWVDDFAAAMGNGDARSDSDLMRSLFCGAGAVGSARPEDYASFMRYAHRSSLTANATGRSLGFRCAQDATDDPESPATTPTLAKQDASVPSASLYQLTDSLHDQRGEVRQLADFRGGPIVIGMVFTHCRYACPALAADCLRLLQATQDRPDLHIVLVSMDPARDEPTVLAAFAEQQHLPTQQVTLLHAPADTVRELAAMLGVRYAEVEGGDFSHSNQLALLNAVGELCSKREGLGGDLTELAKQIRAQPCRTSPIHTAWTADR